jgi:hypothetical protein
MIYLYYSNCTSGKTTQKAKFRFYWYSAYKLNSKKICIIFLSSRYLENAKKIHTEMKTFLQVCPNGFKLGMNSHDKYMVSLLSKRQLINAK